MLLRARRKRLTHTFECGLRLGACFQNLLWTGEGKGNHLCPQMISPNRSRSTTKRSSERLLRPKTFASKTVRGDNINDMGTRKPSSKSISGFRLRPKKLQMPSSSKECLNFCLKPVLGVLWLAASRGCCPEHDLKDIHQRVLLFEPHRHGRIANKTRKQTTTTT